MITKALKEEAWILKEAFCVFVVKLYGFCLSVAYIACQRHPYIESTNSLIRLTQCMGVNGEALQLYVVYKKPHFLVQVMRESVSVLQVT